MEIKRKIYNKMLAWKTECNGSKALFLEGARRIGKSTIAQKFAQNEYASFILLDFNKPLFTLIEGKSKLLIPRNQL